MIKKYRTIINSLILTMIMSIGLFGCASFDDEPEEEVEQERQIGQTPAKEKVVVPVKQDSNSEKSSADDERPNEGVIRVRRHGPGYDVSMDINASDENIAFLMDLPQQKQVDKLKKDIYASAKMVMEAQSLFYKEKYMKALATTDAAIELAPDNPQAHALRGTILFKLQKTQDAVYAWQRALELDPALTDISATLKKLGIKE